MKVIVIGAGAAGLMAASFAKANGHDVVVVERNPRVARKVMITGKGRCNVTNLCDASSFLENVLRNPRFLHHAIARFGPSDTMTYLEQQGVPLKVERGNRVFPVSDKAVDIVDALYRGCKGCRFMFNSRVDSLLFAENGVRGIRLEDGREEPAEAVVVATGGCSYPLTGSTGDGYRLAESAEHTVISPLPSLVPINIVEPFCNELSGLSLKNVALSVIENGKLVFEDFGEMLFTHFGVSGPIVLSASTHISDASHCILNVDLKPALTQEQLDARLLRDFQKHSAKTLGNAMTDLLPKSLIPVVLAQAKLDVNLRVAQMSKESRKALILALKSLTMHADSLRPIEEAIVTRGGVDVKEINPKTMESKRCKGLFFAGEVLDLDAYTGGYNLQIAFATGVTAGCGITDNRSE